MAVETATYISQLDITKPAATDPKSEGDDHLRLLKSTSKATFPNFTAAPLLATQAQLDKLVTSVAVNASAPANSASIDATGNFGIGTTSPQAPLQVLGAQSIGTTRKLKTWIGGASSWGIGGVEELGVGFSGIRSMYTGADNWALVFTAGTSSAFTAGTQPECMRIDSSGNSILQAQTIPPTLTINGQMVFNLTSNTNLRISVRGSDGITRVANITLA